MELLKSKADLRDEVKAANAEREEAIASLEVVNKELAEAKQAVADKDIALASALADLKVTEGQVEALTEEKAGLEEQVDNLKADLELERESAMTKAHQELAKLGHEPVREEAADDRTEEEKVIAGYKAIDPGNVAERRAYRKANKEFFPGE